MPRIFGSGQTKPQLLPDIPAHADTRRVFKPALMRTKHRERRVDQAVPAFAPPAFMTVARYIPQGLRSTLR